jgi:hypothetical protein
MSRFDARKLNVKLFSQSQKLTSFGNHYLGCTFYEDKIYMVFEISIKSRIFIHCEKRFAIFPSTAEMSLTKLSLGGNNLIIPV